LKTGYWKNKGVFEYWAKEENFKAFKITKDKKLEWGEDIDMDPDAFYLKLVGKSFEEQQLTIVLQK